MPRITIAAVPDMPELWAVWEINGPIPWVLVTCPGTFPEALRDFLRLLQAQPRKAHYDA